MHALRVEKNPMTEGTLLRTRGIEDDFACHLLGAGVCVSDRWRPPTAARPLNLAWKGQTGSQGRTGTPTNEGSKAKHGTDLNGLSERPERSGKRCRWNHEEGPWAGKDMDEAGEIMLGISTNVESWGGEMQSIQKKS